MVEIVLRVPCTFDTGKNGIPESYVRDECDFYFLFQRRENRRRRRKTRKYNTARTRHYTELQNLTARRSDVGRAYFFIAFFLFYIYTLARARAVFVGLAKVLTNPELQLRRFTYLCVKHELNGYVGQHFPKSFYGYFYLAGAVKCSAGAPSQRRAQRRIIHRTQTYYNNFIGKLFPALCIHRRICDPANHCRLMCRNTRSGRTYRLHGCIRPNPPNRSRTAPGETTRCRLRFFLLTVHNRTAQLALSLRISVVERALVGRPRHASKIVEKHIQFRTRAVRTTSVAFVNRKHNWTSLSESFVRRIPSVK